MPGIGTTTYGDISQRTAAWAAVQQLNHAEPVIVLGKFGQTKPLPSNTANAVKFRRALTFGALTTPLTEGVTPSSQKFGYEDVLCTLKQYGGWFEITDVVMDMSEDPVLRDANEACGEQAGLTVEMVTYGVIKAGSNVFYSNGTARNSVNTPVSLSKLQAVIRALSAQKAKRITSVVSASPKYGTRAVEASYIAFCHTDCDSDVRAIAGFVPCAEYGQMEMVCPQEIGCVQNIRFVTSPELASFVDAGGTKGGSGTDMVSAGGTSADVYPIIVIGKEAYGVVPLKGKNAITPMVVNPKPAVGDPLAQRGSVGWKTYHAAVILNELWMARLEVAVTAL